jgi:pseudouridine kinase
MFQGGKPVVAVYGGANLDIQAKSHSSFLPGDSNPGSLHISPGGVGRNIAGNLACLGLCTELVSLFGTDALATVLTDSLKAAGIRYDRSIFLPGKPTSAYVCLLDTDGSLAGAVAAMELFDGLTLEMMETSWQAGDEADLVILDGNLPRSVLVAALSRWPGKPVLFDPVSEAKAGRGQDLLGKLGMIKPNLREAELLAGITPASQSASGTASSSGSSPDQLVVRAKTAARSLIGLGVREAFVSIGALGLVYADADLCGLVSPLDLPVVNVSGAGDAATAGIATGTLCGYDVAMKAAMAMVLASRCAASPLTVADGTTLEDLLDAAGQVSNETL